MQTPPRTSSSQTQHQANSFQPQHIEQAYLLPPYAPPNEPWKTVGYPIFSQWTVSCHDFFVVRRFSRLGARALLLLQDDLVRLEEEIKEMDEFSKNMRPGMGGTGSFRMDIEEAKTDDRNKRDRTTRTVAAKLKEYYELLGLVSAIKSRPDAHPYQVRNIRDWLEDNSGAIKPPECKFIQKKET